MSSNYPCRDCGTTYCYKNCEEFNTWLEKAKEALKLQDTIVYCKDCRHFNEREGYCYRLIYDMASDEIYPVCENDFCSQGERKC